MYCTMFIAVFLSKKAPVKRLNKIILESDKTYLA